ncbi:MAG: branched-chain amino acid ABC transporter permease [Rhodobacteraceae bacterium]|nr:branched-chain amino acid ABC transporter permease [Paracoccaceae bacterium]
MDTFIQIVISGLVLGSMYSVSAIGLTLLWGALNVLNMAHGAFLVAGGYAAYYFGGYLGLPAYVAIPGALATGVVLGLLVYAGVARPLRKNANFETTVIIATVGVALVIENLVQKGFGAYPLKQPLSLQGGFNIAQTFVPWNSVLVCVVSIVLLVLLDFVVRKTRYGRMIRAVAQNYEAARLMGIRTGAVYRFVFAISGLMAAISGIMLSTATTLSPTMGYDPMLKAFIVCVIAGLGEVRGALIAAFALGVLEATVQFQLGVRFALPLLLLLVVVTLIFRPQGLLRKNEASRL